VSPGRVWAAAGLLLFGCGGAKPSKPAEAPSGGTAQSGSLESPIMTCGPKDSYGYIAQRFACPDGSNPFAGDLERAARSRQGSQPSERSGDVIDVYRVPCPTGDVTVYIDMYGCEEYRNRLHQFENREFGPAATKLVQAYSSGQFEEVARACRAGGGGSPDDAQTLCIWLEPAALEVLGRTDEADQALKRVCDAMPRASARSDARAKLLVLVLASLSDVARAGQYRPTEAQRQTLPGHYAGLCGVPEAQLRQVVQRVRS
jgi:hypothetical protein